VWAVGGVWMGVVSDSGGLKEVERMSLESEFWSNYQ